MSETAGDYSTGYSGILCPKCGDVHYTACPCITFGQQELEEVLCNCEAVLQELKAIHVLLEYLVREERFSGLKSR
jgi:hypothetical protein